MQKTLLTFLGKGRDDASTGYRLAQYVFPDGVVRRTAFFGLALADFVRPGVLVLLGTAGSMWSVLLESLAVGGEDEALRLELMEAECAGRVDQPLLDRVASLLSRSVGLEVRPSVIPAGENAEEQVAILATIARVVPEGVPLEIDVTHGFRHLGMVGLLSAELIARLRPGTEVQALWYAALDMTREGRTPVVSLSGLKVVQQWVRALDRFDANNDYGVFAPLLLSDGLPADKAKCLSMAASFEGISNVSDAARQLRTVLPSLDQPLRGASELFRTALRRRLEWARLGDLSQQQLVLARRAMEREDLLRAVIFGLESWLTRLCVQQGKDPLDYIVREQVDVWFQSEIKAGNISDQERLDYWNLKNLRNAMAHGTVPSIRFLQQLMQNPVRLQAEIGAILKRIGA
ncbi:MAG: hypothetical protein OHK0048_26970 [Rhodoferax sp.]